jgi:hypothetical protein
MIACVQFGDDMLSLFWVQWDSSDDDQPVRKRKLHRFERTSTCAHKIRKKWSEIEEKTLLEGVKK